MTHETSFADFTESAYVGILTAAKKNYLFSRFTTPSKDKHVLWRHDVDFSMHRALRLAQLEKEAGVIATYFIHLHSLFYHFLSRPILDIIIQIGKLGHDLGLHFDPQFYSESDLSLFEKKIELEKSILQEFTGLPVVAVSFHNYGILEKALPEKDQFCGLINTYGPTIRKNYGYVSDSNGIWRFRKLQDVLTEAKEEKLQVLTHPEWWTPEVLSPRARVQRCIDGYAAAIGKDYDQTLSQWNRPNIR